MRFAPITHYITSEDARSVTELFHYGATDVESIAWRYDEDGRNCLVLSDSMSLVVVSGQRDMSARFIVKMGDTELFEVQDVQIVPVEPAPAPDSVTGTRLTVVGWLFLDSSPVGGVRVAVIEDASGVVR